MTGEFIKALRIKLGMSQEQFSECYHIPISALRNWEQDRRNPDPSAQAFLNVIDAIPDVVKNILSNRNR